MDKQFGVDDDTSIRMFWEFELYLNSNKEIIEDVTEAAKAERKI